jgi:hypothetical protein
MLIIILYSLSPIAKQVAASCVRLHFVPDRSSEGLVTSLVWVLESEGRKDKLQSEAKVILKILLTISISRKDAYSTSGKAYFG